MEIYFLIQVTVILSTTVFLITYLNVERNEGNYSLNYSPAINWADDMTVEEIIFRIENETGRPVDRINMESKKLYIDCRWAKWTLDDIGEYQRRLNFHGWRLFTKNEKA